MATYLGSDVLDVTDPDRGSGAEDEVERRIIVLDSLTGTRTSFTADAGPTSSRVFRWRCFSRAEWRTLRTFLDGKFGRAIPFWLNTQEADLTLAADVGASDLTITGNLCGYTAQLFPFRARRHLAIYDKLTGTRYLRRVTDAVAGATTETLTLESALGAGVTAASSLVSFLRLSRMDTDRPRIEWSSGHYCECDLPIRELAFDAAAQ